MLTPDSSRYWLAESWRPGANPPSLDKQYPEGLPGGPAGWNKQPPAPHLPEDVIRGVRERYLDLAARFGIRV